MSAAKHTPGPWKAVRNASFWEVVTPLPGQTLDQANEYSPSLAYVWGEGEEQAEANARLIAAAPELLEALKEIVGFWDSIVPGECVNDMHVKARAAIAKATGETV
jgi:hypothetical protein